MNKILLLLSFIISLSAAAQNVINIVPMPAKTTMPETPGTFAITKNTTIVLTGKGMEKSAAFLNDYLQHFYGFSLKLATAETPENSIVLTYSIVLKYKRENNDIPGAYNLEVAKNGINIAGDNETGVFYGIQTLIQLLPVEKKSTLNIPWIAVSDKPRFAYRGMHLDVGRHFMPVSFIKKYIDFLALHKFNNFHWHLTEDQGWRIEIKKYPLLTQEGGCRAQTLVGRYGSNKYDGTKYCGFYTQEQIKEIVRYAANRYINIIPEIEMPGHALAAITAYPELSCTPSEPKKVAETWGVFEDVFTPTENTFTFLENVLDEVMALFPSRIIHIGGDECPKEAWKKSAFCQQLIKDKGLKNEHGLQSYFIQRIEKYINSKGRKIIGWDEILEGGLAPNAAVMSWRGEEGGIEAAKQNHDVIMTPGAFCYLDHSQSKHEDSVTIGGYLPLETVYSYEPIPAKLSATEAKHILGAQGNVWTEYMNNPSKVEYMIFPRMSALAEVLWSPKDKRNWKSFESRMPALTKRYQFWGVHFSKAYYDLEATISPTEKNNGVYWNLESKSKDEKIMYKKNEGSATAYTAPILVDASGAYTAVLSAAGKEATSGWLDQKFSFNKATGKKITIVNQPDGAYPGNGAFTLVDGVQNEKGLAKSSEFLGFNGKDLDATIDLGTNTDVSKIRVHVFGQQGSWIYLPSQVEVIYLPAGQLTAEAEKQARKEIKTADPIKEKDSRTVVIESKQNCRHLHITVKNFGTIPAGNPGASNPAWLFVDEIEVE